MRTRSAAAQTDSSSWLKQFQARQLGEHASGDFLLGAPARVVAEFSSRALRANYLAIHEQVVGQGILPMVKANGYGHGAPWAARTLLDLPGFYGVGVATLVEGAELRVSLGQMGRRTRIFVFSGACGWSEEKGEFCEKHGLTPIIAADSDWEAFARQGWMERIPYELKFNTGMNRLGMSLSQAPLIAKLLRGKPAEWHPSGVLSHLAIAEDPEAPLSRAQLERFLWLRAQLGSVLPSAHFHLGNSAAIWNQKSFGLKGLTDVVRPGLSLYGITPWDKAPQRGIFPVCTLRASVLAVHRLKPGDSIGYGARYKVNGAKPVYAAILAAGYADGVSRRLSGGLGPVPGLAPPEALSGESIEPAALKAIKDPKGLKGRGRASKKAAQREVALAEREERGGGGYVWLGGKERRFLGIVSMDLCAVTCDVDTRAGDWAELLGPQVDIWAQARAAGTIPYELLTSISSRVQRIYD